MPRLLYIPMYSSPQVLETDSTYNWAKIFFRQIVQEDPKAFVYFGVPEGCTSSLDEIDHPRIYRFPVKVSTIQYLESARLQEVYVEQFNHVYGRYFVDYVVCDKAPALPWLKAGLEIWDKTANPPVVYLSKTHFIFDGAAISWLAEDLERLQSFGYALADVVLWASEEDYKRAFRIAERYLSPALLDAMGRSRYRGGFIANFDVAHQIARPSQDKPKTPITLSWAYGGNVDYHLQEVFDAFDQIYKLCPQTRVLVTCPSSGQGRAFHRILKDKPYLDVHFGLPQREYLRKIRDAHVFVHYPSRPATISAAVIEQQLLGLVGVFPADARRPASLYPEYPYLFSDKKEMFHLTKYLVEHYFDDAVQDVICRQREHVETYFDSNRDALLTYQHMQRLYAQKEEALVKGIRPGIIDFLAEKTAGLQEIDMRQIFVLFKRMGRVEVDLGYLKKLAILHTCPAQIRWLMKQVGFEDACDGPDIRFVRRPVLETEGVHDGAIDQ